MKAWSGKSLRERVMIFASKFGEGIITFNSLRLFYRENNIVRQPTQTVYRQALIRQPELYLERNAFAKVLGNIIRHG